MTPIWTHFLSIWPQNQPQVSQDIKLTHTHYVTHQSLHTKINCLQNTNTSWNRQCRNWLNIVDKNHKLKRKYHPTPGGNNLNTYSRPYHCINVFSLKLAIILDNSWHRRMLKSPRMPETNVITIANQIWIHSVKSPTDVGRTNLFQDGHSNHRIPIVHKPYLIPMKYKKLINEEITTTRECSCILKSLGQWVAPVIIVSQKTRSFTS